MTTIVGDWRRKVIVTDSQYSDTDTNTKYFDEKCSSIPGGWFAGAGHFGDCEKVLQYLRTNRKTPPKLKNNDNEFMILTDEGIEVSNDGVEWEPVRNFMAIGSGAMAAEVCMRMGLSAEEAVKWACDVDAKSHEPIKTYNL